jgi:hypothetical protein
MSNWEICVHISSDTADDVILKYVYDANITGQELYQDLNDFMIGNRRQIYIRYNLGFDYSDQKPDNWYLTDISGNTLDLFDNIYPANLELYLRIIEDVHQYNAPSPDPVSVTPLQNDSSSSAQHEPHSLVGKLRRKELSPEELRDFRDKVDKFDEEQTQKWKGRYIQKLIGNNTGIGMLCEYYYLEAVQTGNYYFVVTHLTETGAAKNAGILVGDRIIYVDGVACKNNYEFKYYLTGEPSSEIVLDLERDGQLMKFKFNRNPIRDTLENAELPTTLGGNRKRLSKNAGRNRKRVSKKLKKFKKSI